MNYRTYSAVLATAVLLGLDACGGAAVAPSGSNAIAPGSNAMAPGSSAITRSSGAEIRAGGERRTIDAVQASPRPYLFVGSNDAVSIDSLPDAKPVASITSGVQGAFDLAMDGSGDLFVANSNQTITEYEPPYSGAPAATITFPGSQLPFAVSVDPQGDLAAAVTLTPQFEIFEPPYSAAPITLSIPVGQVQQLTVDGNRNVLVLAIGGHTPNHVYEYAAPYTSAPTEPIKNLPPESNVLNVDPEGNLWIAGVHYLYEYAPPYTGAPLVTYTESSKGTYLQDPIQITFVGKRDNVGVLNSEFGDREYVWPPPYTTPAGINRSVSLYDSGQNVVGTQTDELWGVAATSNESELELVRWTGNFHDQPSTFDAGQPGPFSAGTPLLISGPVTL